ncbi:Fibronectin type III domain-containing protein [Chryseobacterium arachidis]|uniref:Fibronectin type III domain-containing protein n=1 Tax=Chryseobacterium arachidis TaxID=1416778 RepID=A0A1M5ABC6_9FLAO|nr:GEVED domain-containing protein [Chryseobacterium arachidis]SHF27598.1 Fibronectin type III domain-containing protein [Chryseobacterium arachidis]
MKKNFTSFFFLFLFAITSAQWSPTTFRGEKTRVSSDIKNYYSLDISLLKSQLANAQETGKNAKPVTIALPTLDGKIEKFAVYSLPVVVKELANQYQLGSYVGRGIDDPGKYLRFSLAPGDFQSMIIKDGKYEFVEPADKDKTVYGVHPKTDKSNEGFLCSMNEDRLSKQEIAELYKAGKNFANQTTDFAKSSDKKFRTMRLAMSVTGEYTQYFGGTVAGALTAINATLTRVNGVFEKDFALRLLLQNYPGVIYSDPATDPYSPAAQMNNWNLQLQQTLTTNVGNANYDIGHLFGASGGGGNAGCIGCVCVNPANSTATQKGSGYTSPADGIPQGDNFDIDYVAHEIGHQLGANHTFSHGLESAGVNVEPGSGSTIMGYAGITGANTDVQPHSDAYFHAVSINQVQNNLVSKTCDIETTINNNPPVIAALSTYNIPKGTAFVLTASATDPENDPLTYCWEQVDNATVTINKNNLGSTASGATFRSFSPTTSPTRYFPKLSSVLAGVLNNSNNGWEAVSTVARNTNFRVTVRDNNPAADQQQTQFANQQIVVGNDGPFKVTTTAAYNNGPTNITWDVVNTTAAPYNVANVKIDYTADNGVTWTVLSASTPNDGNESINITGLTVGATIKIRVSAIGNVFYAIGTATVASLLNCTGVAPTGIVVSAITQTTATVTWTATANSTYVIRYRPVGSATWITVNSTGNSVNLTGLSDGIQYEVQVSTVCSGVQGPFSASTNFTTLGLTYCTQTSSNFSSEYISNVTVTPVGAPVMSNNSAGSTYTDYTNTPSALVNLVIGSTGNTVSVTKFFPFSIWSEAVSVWIDFNRNGVFEASERVMNSPSSTTTPVSATFDVPATAYNGPATTRMRVVMQYNATPVICTSFSDGEVEDYAVKLIQPIPCTSNAPLNLSVSNITATSAYVMWDPAIGATYILQYRPLGSTTWTTVPLTTSAYTINGLTESTQYEVQVAYVCSGTTGTFTAPYPFTTPAVTYCNITATTNNNGYISNVTIAPTNSYIMSNNSLANSYTNYSPDPAKLVTLVRNSTNNSISIAKSWLTTTQSSLAVGAWIDFNRNGIFETGERVVSTTASTTTPITATFTVPATSYNGPLTLRMRVIVSTSTITDPCATVANGEIEDYAVRIIDLAPCTTAAPSPIVVSNVTASTASVSWINATGATYTLRYRTGTGAWIVIANATNPYTIINLNASTTYEVQVATICGGTTGPWSSSVNFTTPTSTYCTPTTTSVTNGYINNITVTGTATPMMTNNSGPSTYTDYSNDNTKIITLARNSTGNVLSVGRTITSGTYSTYAWLDLNGDGVFNNNPIGTGAGERVMALGYSSTTPVTATFAVPASAYSGTNKVKMRIIVYYYTPTDACSPLTSDGEVEDYQVRFIDIQPCTTAAPSGITLTNVGATTATVSWISSTGATYLVRWRTTNPVGTWITSPVVNGNTYNITGLTEQTAYEVQVATICGGTQGPWSTSTPFTTTPITYCSMTGTGTTDFISNVTMTSVNPGIPPMSNTSVQTNYISYTTPATLVNLEIGSVGNKISVAKGWSGTAQSDAVSAWIDFNRNGVFETSEQIMASAASATSPVTALFNVPNNAYNGPLTTTMRVVLKRSSAPVMCQNAVNGEVEDYAVRLRPCSTAVPTNLAFNTITHTSANVTWTVPTGALTFIVRYRVAGTTAWTDVVASTLTANPPLALTGLTPATTYEVQIATSCGTAAGTYTATQTFTTRCDPTPPNVTIGTVTTNSAVINWAPVAASSTYVIRYRIVGSGAGGWITINVTTPPLNTYTITGLSPYTTYEVQVANKCNGETTVNPWSNPKVFTTERTCELPPPGLTITNLTPTTAVVTWTPFPGATYILRYRKVGIPSWTTVTSNTNTITLTGLIELTQYEMQVANVCSGTPGNYTLPYFFTTPTIVYCQMHSTTGTSEYISKVTVTPNGKAEMTNPSLASNYTDYTGVTNKFIELIQGSANNKITIDKKLTGNAKAGVAVWIDFNRNGYFDIDERILVASPSADATATGTFTVPADAFVSLTDYKYVVMRVAMSKDAIPVNCTNFANGEVEDYTVRISKLPVPNPINQTDILIYPNPVSTVLYVKNISKKASYKIYSASGQLVSNGIILNNKIDVHALINGVYVIDIMDGDTISVQKKFIKE